MRIAHRQGFVERTDCVSSVIITDIARWHQMDPVEVGEGQDPTLLQGSQHLTHCGAARAIGRQGLPGDLVVTDSTAQKAPKSTHLTNTGMLVKNKGTEAWPKTSYPEPRGIFDDAFGPHRFDRGHGRGRSQRVA